MPDSGTQARRDDSRRWSEDLLREAGFVRRANSSVFVSQGDCYILSPGVGPGQSERFWFDLREANLSALPVADTTVVLRIVNRGYVVVPLSEFEHHLNERTRRLTPAGPAYGFHCEFDDGIVRLKSSSDAGYSFSEPLLDRNRALARLH